MASKCVIFVNLDANNGRAAQRWRKIAASVAKIFPADVVELFQTGTDMEPKVQEMLAKGFGRFVSAGGDGSANFLLNMLLRLTGENARHITLGGIGLGSSNDFIKPRRNGIMGLPTRLDTQNTTLVDVGKAVFQTGGVSQTRYFIANASLGVTAQANWLFNHGDWFIRHTKDRWTDLAILYTAVKTILAYQNFPAELENEGKYQTLMLSNLAVLKSPFVSGSFHFDDPVQRDDGFLGVNICLDMDKVALIGTLRGLARGRFRGRPKTTQFATKAISLNMPFPVALEMDGEVFQAQSVQFSVLPGAIQLMGL